MSIIRETIKFQNTDLNIKFPLQGSGEFTGYQQEIDNYTVIKSGGLINEPTDGEVKRFKYLNSINNPRLDFHFLTNSGAYSRAYYAEGFSYDDISKLSNNYLNSFYIVDIFDTYRSENQTKIATTYLTKLYDNTQNYDVGDDDNLQIALSMYDIDLKSQLYYLNIPSTFINGRTSGSQTVYCRFSFYDAKTGKIVLFSNEPYSSSPSQLRMYVRGIIMFGTNDWYWEHGSENVTSLYEMYNSAEYIEKYNKTFDNYENLAQNYPTGNTFNYETGTYTDGNE